MFTKTAALLASALLVNGNQDPFKRVPAGVGCTAIGVTADATFEKTAMAGMNTDCSSCDNRLTYISPKSHPNGERRAVYANLGGYPRMVTKGRASLYEPENNVGWTPFEPVGYVDLPAGDTFGYHESTLPLGNEKGLSIGESSCGTRIVSAPGTAILDITELLRISSERCETALCSIELMGKLVEEYGFMSMANEITPGHQRGGEVAYDDAGESAILADSTGDVWVFNVAGGVANVTKGIWAAQRVPKGHLTVISNSYTVRELPLTPNDDFKFNTKIREACKAFGIWSDVDSNGKPNTVFDFAKTLGLENLTFRSGKGDPIPLYSSLRSWRILSLAAADPHMKLSLNINDMPFSVRVANKLSHRDVMSYFSDYYKDTEFDLTQGVLAGPFSLPYRLEGGPTQIGGQVPRGISIPRTSYSVLGQSAPSHGRSTRPAIVWFAIDQPMTSVYVPLVAKMNTTSVLGDENQVIDESYRVGTLLKFDRKSAFWAFDFVSNWMTINFRNMSTEVVFPAQKKLQDAIDEKIESELIPMLSSNSHMAKVGDWQRELQNWVVSTWWALSDDLIVIYNDGYFSRIKSEYLSDAYPEVIGKSYGLPKWWGEMVGITDDIHPIWVQPSTVLNTATLPIGCCAVPKNQVPSKFDEKALKWVYANQEQFMEPTINGVESNVTDADENWKYTPSNSVLGTFLASTLSAVGGLATGYFIAKKQFDLFSSPKRRPLLEDC